MSDVASRSEFVRLRGLRYHVRRWGDPGAPAILLLHGWLDVSATWQFVAEPLLDRFQVLCPDWRGLGHSEWPQDGYWFQDYVADLDALDRQYAALGPWRLVGHSMGGQVATLFAGLRPARVRRLVVLDALFVPDMPPVVVPRRFTKWLEDVRRPPRQKTYPSFEDLAGRIQKRHPELDAARAMHVARHWAREDGHGRIALCADPKHRLSGPGLYKVAESMAVWRQVTAPTLFVEAGTSNFAGAVDTAEMQRRRDCFGEHRALRIDAASHMMHFSAPQATAQAIGDFMAD